MVDRNDPDRLYETRPEQMSDIEGILLKGKTLDSIAVSEFAICPDALKLLGDFLQCLLDNGFDVRTELGNAQVTREFTGIEAQEQLKQAQRDWDRRRDLYEAAKVDGERPDEPYQCDLIYRFCKDEGLVLPWLNIRETKEAL